MSSVKKFQITIVGDNIDNLTIDEIFKSLKKVIPSYFTIYQSDKNELRTSIPSASFCEKGDSNGS